MGASLDAGVVIRRVFSIYVDQAPVLMPAAAVVFVFTGILRTLLIAASPVLALVAAVIALAAITLFTGMVVELVADIQDGRRDATVGQLLRAVTPVLGRLMLVGVIAGLGIVIGFVAIDRAGTDPDHDLVGDRPGRRARAPTRPGSTPAQP